MGVEENQSVGTPSSATKRKRKLGGDSEDDDDDDDDSDDQPEEEEEEEEEEIKKVKKVETYDEVRWQSQLHYKKLRVCAVAQRHFLYFFFLLYQDEVDHATSVEELEKQIEKMAKVCRSWTRLNALKCMRISVWLIQLMWDTLE